MSTDDLRHYTDLPLSPAALTLKEQGLTYKPSGLWVSVGSEWEEWCRDEQYELGRLQRAYRVELAPTARLLTLGSAADIDAFTVAYRSPDSRPCSAPINWAAVASQYDGILITPYQWSRRLTEHTHWYYGWDCASGCIWNPAAVRSLTEFSAEVAS